MRREECKNGYWGFFIREKFIFNLFPIKTLIKNLSQKRRFNKDTEVKAGAYFSNVDCYQNIEALYLPIFKKLLSDFHREEDIKRKETIIELANKLYEATGDEEYKIIIKPIEEELKKLAN